MVSIMDANWSRRGLLTAMSTAALGRAQALRLPRKVTLGIVGYDGHLSEILDHLADFPEIELAAVADANSDPQATRATFRNPAVARARRYRDYPEMLRHERLDCAAICNQNGSRAAAIVACAERKLAVIAEKPMAISRREFEAVVAAVEGNRVHAGMLLPMRFDPPYLAMKEIVDSGEIGDVAQIDAQKSYQLDNRPDWQKHAKTYGSTILWIGVHMIDLMAFTSGRGFTEAASFQGHVAFPELGDMQNATATIFRLDNGGTATLRLDYLRPPAIQRHGDDRLRLAGTRGVVEYREDSSVTVLSPRGQRKVTSLPPRGSVFADFVQSAFAGARSALPWSDIRRANEWTIAAQEAADTGMPARAFPPQPVH